MNEIRPVRPGRHKPPRPYGSYLASLLFLLLLSPRPAAAQITTLWTELSQLIAPEAGLGGGPVGSPLPIMGWHSTGACSMGVLGPSPMADPLLWLDTKLPIIRFARNGILMYRARRELRRSSDLSADCSSISVATPLLATHWSFLWGGASVGAVTQVDQTGDMVGVHRQPTGRHTWIGLRGRGAGWEGLVSWGRLGYFRGAGEAAAALRISLLWGWTTSVWASRRVADDRIVFSYKDDAASVTAPGSFYSTGVRLTGSVGSWRVCFRAKESRGSGRGGEKPMHRLRPRPRLRLAELRADSPDGRWQAAVGMGWGEHRADLESQGLRYGRFLLHDDRLWIRAAWNTPWKKGTLRLWSGFCRTGLDGEGDVEFWPFTPTIIDLLGLRRRARADARIGVMSAGGRGSLRSEAVGSFVLGVDVHHVWTSGELESWEPIVLGVGRRNIFNDQLSIRSAQCMDLGIQGHVRLGEGLGLQGGLAQLVPLAVQKRVRPAVGAPSEPDRPAAKTQWGGLRWWIALQLTIGEHPVKQQ